MSYHTTPVEEFLLLQRCMGKLLEELGGLVAVCARIKIQGLDAIDPGTGLTNRERFTHEAAGVLAQLNMSIGLCVTPPAEFNAGQAQQAARKSFDAVTRNANLDEATREHLRLAVEHIAALNGALEDLASLGATIAICGTKYDDAAAREVVARAAEKPIRWSSGGGF